ncbi:MAG: thioredoxin family protein [Nitrososphaerales archaeon]|jgi:thiol-disulfide isomerase/thioredoxin
MKISNWLGKSEFKKIQSEPGLHVIVFAAKWCPFCSRFLVQARSLENASNVEINLIDADDPDESLWDDFSIKKVPTIIVFKDGKSVFRRDGRSFLSPSGAGLKMSDLQQALSELSSAS